MKKRSRPGAVVRGEHTPARLKQAAATQASLIAGFHVERWAECALFVAFLFLKRIHEFTLVCQSNPILKRWPKEKFCRPQVALSHWCLPLLIITCFLLGILAECWM